MRCQPPVYSIAGSASSSSEQGARQTSPWVSGTSLSALVTTTWSNQKPRKGAAASVPYWTTTCVGLPAFSAEPRSAAEKALDAQVGIESPQPGWSSMPRHAPEKAPAEPG